jgi:2,4-dienoyl-CoA reductase-like NADH-dependent reductase (Old Yellow Enzyme family)
MTDLFESLQINHLELKNRFVRSATVDNLGRNGMVTQAQVDMYDTLSKGDIGLIVTGGLYPTKNGMGIEGQLSAHTDDAILSLKKLADVVHASGAKIAGQILHCGFRCREELTGTQPVGPSAMSDPQLGNTVRALSGDEIYEMIESYVRAAARIIEAGFDAVQLHGAHGWFLSAFLSPAMNRREDEWGGSTEKRARFLRLICQGIRNMAGPDYPVLIKLGLKDYHPQGKSLSEGIATAMILEASGIDAIEVSEGIEENWGHHIRRDATRPYYLEECKQARKALSLPLILVGGMRDLKDMQTVLDDGIADAVSFCRPFIQDPSIISKFKKGETTRSACTSCNECLEEMIHGNIHCVLN